MCICQSQSLNSSYLSFPILLSTGLFSIFVCLFLLCNKSYYFSRFQSQKQFFFCCLSVWFFLKECFLTLFGLSKFCFFRQKNFSFPSILSSFLPPQMNLLKSCASFETPFPSHPLCAGALVRCYHTLQNSNLSVIFRFNQVQAVYH